MGEAKKRGTFDERKNMAIKLATESHKRRNRNMIPKERSANTKSIFSFSGLAGIAAGLFR